jgi:opacity protein-like surface antigen
MKRFFRAGIVACLFSCSALMAENVTMDESDRLLSGTKDYYSFLGIMGSYSQDLEGETIAGIRFGGQNELWRTMVTYEDNFEEYQALMLEADRTVLAGLLGGKMRLYAGLIVGWIGLSGDRLESDGSLVAWEDYGFTYGGSAGLMLYVSEQVDVSIGYRYLFLEGICDEDSMTGATFAIHYFF